MSGGAVDPGDGAVLTGDSVLIVIPCLNEAKHIDGLLAQWRRVAASDDLIVVADGGSGDGTRAIVARHEAGDARVSLLDNPERIQACAINLAVARSGEGRAWLLRVDAHCLYPDDYARTLIEEARATGADAVVVAMETVGSGLVQRANAAAQSSPVGNGGSAHRRGAAGGRWVDHGHHALMRMDAFRAVGGYDETFTHNEDAELDHRLRAAGYRIYLTTRTRCTYFPRATLPSLFRQYLAYGGGRARNVLKHRSLPRVRQMIPLLVAPAAAFAVLGVVSWLALVPVALWMAACAVAGAAIAARHRDPRLVLSGLSAALMHLGWSLGFWLHIARHIVRHIARRAFGTSRA